MAIVSYTQAVNAAIVTQLETARRKTNKVTVKLDQTYEASEFENGNMTSAGFYVRARDMGFSDAEITAYATALSAKLG